MIKMIDVSESKPTPGKNYIYSRIWLTFGNVVIGGLKILLVKTAIGPPV